MINKKLLIFITLSIFTAFINIDKTLGIERFSDNLKNCYSIEDNLDVKFYPLNKNLEKTLDKVEKQNYKKILKNEKYISKSQVLKADKFYKDFVPNKIRLVTYYENLYDYNNTLKEFFNVQKLDNLNIYLDSSIKDYHLGRLYAKNGDYLNSNKILIPYSKKNNKIFDLSNLQIGENYFYMQDYKSAIPYLNQISSKSRLYIKSQELLYSSYLHQKNNKAAYNAAKNLVHYDKNNPENYFKLAFITTNQQEKLNNFYKAKNIYYGQQSLNIIDSINRQIAPLEQNKIDLAFKKITAYCKKPDWNKIRSKNANLLADDILYWDKRQDDFFESTNNCISKYTGSNLIACFNDINKTQEELDKELINENARRIEIKQRDEQNKLLLQQNLLIQEQNRLQNIRNYNYYPRYYDYYWGRYPWWY